MPFGAGLQALLPAEAPPASHVFFGRPALVMLPKTTSPTVLNTAYHRHHPCMCRRKLREQQEALRRQQEEEMEKRRQVRVL